MGGGELMSKTEQPKLQKEPVSDPWYHLHLGGGVCAGPEWKLSFRLLASGRA